MTTPLNHLYQELVEWLDATGVASPKSSYEYELKSFLDDAFDIGKNSMMKVVKLRTVPNAETIETLRDLLSRAESGDIQGAAFILLCGESNLQTGWTGVVGENPNQTLGGVAVLQSRLVSIAMEVSS